MEEMLDCRKINLYIVLGISKAIEEEYNYSISCFYDEMENSFLKGILETIEKSLKIFCKKTTITFELIDKIKSELILFKS